MSSCVASVSLIAAKLSALRRATASCGVAGAVAVVGDVVLPRPTGLALVSWPRRGCSSSYEENSSPPRVALALPRRASSP